MSVPLLLTVLLGATDAGPIKLAMTGLTTVNLEAKTADLYADYFAQQLSAAGGVQVTTQSQVAGLLGLERQKELLGCSSTSASCLAELSGALGVDGVVVGSLGKLGSELVSTLKIISAKDGRTLADASTRVSSESALLDWMAKTAASMAKELKQLRGASDSSAAPHVEAGPSARSRAWIPAALGGVLVVAGGIFLGLAAQRASTLDTGRGTYATTGALDQAVAEGRLFQTLGSSFLGAGVAAAAVGLGLYLFAGDGGGPSAALAVGPSGLLLTGSWP